MPIYEIPLSPEAQKFTIDLAGETYQINLYWCGAANAWVMDLADTLGTPIISGIPLVANTDLFAQYPYLNLGGQLIAQTDNAPNSPPTYNNLGSAGRLYFVTP